MTHALHDYRAAIEALIGPVEDLISKTNATLPVGGPSDVSYLRAYVVGGLEQALETLTEARTSIDEHVDDDEVETEFDEDEVDDAAR